MLAAAISLPRSPVLRETDAGFAVFALSEHVQLLLSQANAVRQCTLLEVLVRSISVQACTVLSTDTYLPALRLLPQVTASNMVGGRSDCPTLLVRPT